MGKIIGVMVIIFLFYSCRKESNIDSIGNVFLFPGNNPYLIISTKQVDSNYNCGGRITPIKKVIEIKERGICWNSNSNPTILNSHLNVGSGLGYFNCILPDLSFTTTYYLRAYAITSIDTSYGNQNTFIYNARLGQSYGGGIIFYIDGSGQHGLVSAPIDQSTFANWESAVELCDNLVLNNYDDWRLPTYEELNLMFENLHLKNIGGFAQYTYWSSTVPSLGYANAINFYTNVKGKQNKGRNIYVRAVREF